MAYRITIKNITAEVNFGKPIDLDKLALKLLESSMRGDGRLDYQTEKVPLPVYRRHGISYIFSSNGKVICTGVRDMKYLEKEIPWIAAIMEKL